MVEKKERKEYAIAWFLGSVTFDLASNKKTIDGHGKEKKKIKKKKIF